VGKHNVDGHCVAQLPTSDNPTQWTGQRSELELIDKLIREYEELPEPTNEHVARRQARQTRLAKAMFCADAARQVAGYTGPLVWQGTLRLLSDELAQCSFWNPLDDRANPFVLLLSKALPQPCQVGRPTA
jgi:hypothetical protein